MRNGVKPVVYDKRDYSFHKTFADKVGSIGVLPNSFHLDALLTMPDQDAENTQFNPPIPPLPDGCTDYGQSELCIDEDKTLWSPMLLENVTHANAEGGCDIRTSLSAAISVYKRAAYFNVDLVTNCDWFDSIRYALFASSRSISIVTPWFQEWEIPIAGVIPNAFVQIGTEPWHNWKVPGWKTIDGIPYLLGKSWQGSTFGDQGWAYFSRQTINSVMSISGTGAFTLAPTEGATIQTIEEGLLEEVVSDLEQIIHEL